MVTGLIEIKCSNWIFFDDVLNTLSNIVCSYPHLHHPTHGTGTSDHYWRAISLLYRIVAILWSICPTSTSIYMRNCSLWLLLYISLPSFMSISFKRRWSRDWNNDLRRYFSWLLMPRLSKKTERHLIFVGSLMDEAYATLFIKQFRQF